MSVDVEEHAEVLRLIAGQLTAHPDPDLHTKLRHFHEHGRLPDPEPVEAEAVEEEASN